MSKGSRENDRGKDMYATLSGKRGLIVLCPAKEKLRWVEGERPFFFRVLSRQGVTGLVIFPVVSFQMTELRPS